MQINKAISSIGTAQTASASILTMTSMLRFAAPLQSAADANQDVVQEAGTTLKLPEFITVSAVRPLLEADMGNFRWLAGWVVFFPV